MTATLARAADVVFTFTFETYADAVHRGMHRPPDRLLTELRRSPRIGKILVANPYRSGPVRAVRTVIGRGGAKFPNSADHSLYTPKRLRREDPSDVPALRVGYLAYDRKLAGVATARGLSSPAAITASPLVAGFCPLAWADPVTFYARDDWAELPARQPWWAAIRAAYRSISASGRSVVAVSQQILDRIEPTGPAAVVPNGVDVGEWEGPQPEEPEWLRAIPRPRAIYVGTLDSRLDVEGLTSLAGQRPELHTVLLGSRTDGNYLNSLVGLSNVHLHGNVGRAELVAAIRSADVALVAHRVTKLTRAMSPLKIYEYLAGGCPVLSVDLPPCRGISERVILTDSVADFSDALGQALDLGRAPESERIAFIHANSWTERHRQILDIALAAA